MFLQPVEKIAEFLETQTRGFGAGCHRVYVSVSGGVDSSVVAAILTRTFGPENVVAMFRNIRSKIEHLQDVQKLQEVLGFNLVVIDADHMYDLFLQQCQEQFAGLQLKWHEENSPEAKQYNWDSAYASLKSRFATPFAGFISKAIDNGNGRIFGTGNAEEDLLLRYFDKFGDGAVDNNILCGLTKMEVRQLAIHYSSLYNTEILKIISEKIPSADLLARGDEHNDESELSSWAKNMGYSIQLSYGDTAREGNIAWALKENLDKGVIAGSNAILNEAALADRLKYDNEQIQLILFLRQIERATRHKELNIPGIGRETLRSEGLVD